MNLSEFDEEVEMVRTIFAECVVSSEAGKVTLQIEPLKAELTEAAVGHVVLQVCGRLATHADVTVLRARGVSDKGVTAVLAAAKSAAALCAEHGAPVLLDLLSASREALTAHTDEAPAPDDADCPICRDPLATADVSSARLPCFHFFHLPCFEAYIQATELEARRVFYDDLARKPASKTAPVIPAIFAPVVPCPVCRVSSDINELFVVAPPSSAAAAPAKEFRFQPSAEFNRNRAKWQEVYQRQLSRGSIIDLEQEANRFLIVVPKTDSDTTVDTVASVPNTNAQPPPPIPPAQLVAASSSSKKNDTSNSRNHHHHHHHRSTAKAKDSVSSDAKGKPQTSKQNETKK